MQQQEKASGFAIQLSSNLLSSKAASLRGRPVFPCLLCVPTTWCANDGTVDSTTSTPPVIESTATRATEPRAAALRATYAFSNNKIIYLEIVLRRRAVRGKSAFIQRPLHLKAAPVLGLRSCVPCLLEWG